MINVGIFCSHFVFNAGNRLNSLNSKFKDETNFQKGADK